MEADSHEGAARAIAAGTSKASAYRAERSVEYADEPEAYIANSALGGNLIRCAELLSAVFSAFMVMDLRSPRSRRPSRPGVPQRYTESGDLVH